LHSPDGRDRAVADAVPRNFVDTHAPAWLKPYARLARWDRPIGIWLLFWPCAFALALAAIRDPAAGFNWWALGLCLVGAVAMRGAGCTFNDIVDRDIDLRVERTRSRPIPSGQVSPVQALAFLIVQALAGLIVLLQFNAFTVALGVASLALIAIYPFMKRITWWPQLFLGLAFNWGALVGWAAERATIGLPPLLLYLGCIAWTVGYDTIYAMQDAEDDALIGVKSTALLFGRRARSAVIGFYALAVGLWLAAGLAAGAGIAFALALLPVAAALGWQVRTLDAREPGNILRRFKSNHWVGLLLTGALLLDWIA
jgi:4-hydroxybenzoate polyprenyltransferase